MDPVSSAVLAALYRGDRAEAERLAGERLAAGAGLDACEAAALGRTDVLEERLAAEPAAARERSSDGFSALHLAAFFSGGAETGRLLLQAGADPGAPAANDTGLHPINSAAAARNRELVGLLLARGADVDAAQRGGYTALHSAAVNGDDGLVEDLLAAGADPARETDDGRTPAALAEERGQPGTARRLREAAAAASGTG